MSDLIDLLDAALLREKSIEREYAVQAVMDLHCALKAIKGQPTLKDLVKLAKRIRKGKKYD